jgi:hypothetical protein
MAIYDPNPFVVYSTAFGTTPGYVAGLWNYAGVGYADGPAIFYQSVLQCITPDGALHKGGGALYTLVYVNQKAGVGFDPLTNKWSAFGNYYAGQAYFDSSNNLIEQTRFVPALTAISGVLHNWGYLGNPGYAIPFGGTGITTDFSGGWFTWTMSTNHEMGHIDKDGVLSVMKGAQYNTTGGGLGYVFPIDNEFGDNTLYLPRTNKLAMLYNNPSGQKILQMDLSYDKLTNEFSGAVVAVPVANSCVYAGQIFGGFAFSGVFGENSGGLYYTEDCISFRPIVDASNNLDFSVWYNYTKCRVANAFGKTYIANFGTMYTSNPGDPPQPTAGAYVLTLGRTQANPFQGGTTYCFC